MHFSDGIIFRILVVVILTGFFAHGLGAQLTINITSIPPTTPPESAIYLAGNFNNWNPGQPDYILTDENNGAFSITFSPDPGTLEYKFTRGSWETVEGTVDGGFIPNRMHHYAGGTETLNVLIAGWEGGSGGHTAEDNVQIMEDPFFIPQLNRHRRIWLYLPPDYHTSSKHYPVIYMQDGQNLFDAFYSFAGEWKIDESMNTLFDEGDHGSIIVGIDNGGPERIYEYSPWVNPNYGGGNGEAYAAFLVETLKPFMDAQYRTLPGRAYTAIAGSSLGANISLYAAVEHQDIFGKVGIFSPAFWFSDSAYIHLMEKGIQQDLRVYFVAGQHESSTNIADMMTMYDALSNAGQDEEEMFFISHPDGAHSEWFWAREYPDAYTWLFDGLLLPAKSISHTGITVYPNPVHDFLSVSMDHLEFQYAIYSSTGQLITIDSSATGSIEVSRLIRGPYFLEIKDPSTQEAYYTRFIKQ